jgi:hypothetical protein
MEAASIPSTIHRRPRGDNTACRARHNLSREPLANPSLQQIIAKMSSFLKPSTSSIEAHKRKQNEELALQRAKRHSARTFANDNGIENNR